MTYMQPNVDDAWLVAFGPNDVRTLSLEQLDDAYRLDVINDETLVCGTAMTSWVPLGVVAGVQSAVPPNRVASDDIAVLFPVAASSGQAGGHGAQRVAMSPAPSSIAPNSMAPAAFDLVVRPEPAARSRLGVWFALALLCVGPLVAHRTGAVTQLASSVGMAGQYEQLAGRVLGAPPVDTLAGTQALLDRINAAYRLDEVQALARRYEASGVLSDTVLSAALKQEHGERPQQAPTPAGAGVSTASKENPTAAEAQEAPTAPAPIDVASLPVAAPEPVAPPQQEATTQAPVSARSATRSKTPQNLDLGVLQQAVKRNKRKKDRFDKAAEYDPLYGGIPQ